MSLRGRVLLGCVVVALVLLVADLALIGTFRGFLLAQVDEQLTQSARRLTDFVSLADRPLEQARPGGPGAAAFSEYYVAIADEDGRLLGRLDIPLHQDRAAPRVPAALVRAAVTEVGAPLEPFTVRSVARGGWRMVAVQSDRGQGQIILLGASLEDVAPTQRRMLALLASATMAVMATLTAVAWWVLRQGVAPLTAMTGTAEAIADGALHERVSDTDQRTEAGRLGAALNTMLARIEHAFAQRASSEDRLRRFVADASHELRTPLTSIRGYAELYRTGALEDDGDLDDAMRRIEEEAARMGGLVEDLLLLAKLDQGRPLEARPVDLARLATDAAADLRAVDPDRPVTLEVRPVIVEGDDARLRQAVGNLLANVRAHTPPATPVRISVGIQDRTAVLTVDDRGPGMPEDVAVRVFERFYRADASRVRPTLEGSAGTGHGSGLGLAIVDGIIQAHGGRATVDSRPGEGTSFRLVLPLSRPDQGPAPS
ncbi:MAG TPA: HAMP domain-containing sensor histidine kinase [Euzebya sp.]|nr:HAMP domain-containing sensor histidine kinase [Euzebya sp.]